MSLPTVENALLQFQAGKSDDALVFWSLVSDHHEDAAGRDEAEALLLRQLTVRREVSEHEARILLNDALEEARELDDPQSLWRDLLEGAWPAPEDAG